MWGRVSLNDHMQELVGDVLWGALRTSISRDVVSRALADRHIQFVLVGLFICLFQHIARNASPPPVKVIRLLLGHGVAVELLQNK